MTQFLMRVNSIRLQAVPPGLEQELVWRQSERLPARLSGPLVLMQQLIPLVWEERVAWEEQVSQA